MFERCRLEATRKEGGKETGKTAAGRENSGVGELVMRTGEQAARAGMRRSQIKRSSLVAERQPDSRCDSGGANSDGSGHIRHVGGANEANVNEIQDTDEGRERVRRRSELILSSSVVSETWNVCCARKIVLLFEHFVFLLIYNVLLQSRYFCFRLL